MNNVPDCVVAAAGYSSRMGTWKPGLSWGDTKMALHTVRQAREAGCRVIVAGGHRYSRLKRMFKGLGGVKTLRVIRWRLGMGYTVSRALRLVETESVFIVPADMPNIRSGDYVRLTREFNRILSGDGDEIEVLRPSFGGKPGHPVLVKGNVAAELQRSNDGTVVRILLEKFRNRLIEWDHPGVIQDLDTPGDYEALRPDVPV